MRFSLFALILSAATVQSAEIIVAEGESFTPKDTKGWKVTHQQDSYGSHTYGGMWMSHGGCLGALADSVGSTAVRAITVAVAGKYRVWSKYQAPPYFHYLHKIDIVQNGKTVFSHVYGRKGTDRLWSFSGESNELWWPWGVDHDSAEAPPQMVDLSAGPAEIVLTTVAGPKPAGDRFVDFVLLTTEPAATYQGFKPYQVGSPFAMESLAATKLYVRFKNTSDKSAQLTVSRAGHFQPQYGGATIKIPAKAVDAGAWSAWENIGPFCRLVHDEGLTLRLGAGKPFDVEFARDAEGQSIVGKFTAADADTAVVPIDITWNVKSTVRKAEDLAREIIAESKTWRKAGGGKKPQEILFYGAFSGADPWVAELKDALGYNTLLPDRFPHVKRDGLHAHAGSPAAIKAFAAKLTDKQNFRVLSFGDEISLGKINYKDAKLNAKFQGWLAARNVTAAEIGVDPKTAVLTDAGNPALVWYSNLFNEEERFAAFREMTELARKEIGEHVLTGANYSPHHLALYYGPIYQWVDIFKHKGMSMIWAEDYIFSVPEVPEIISWQFAQMRCGAKYHDTPIHFYVMPHAPGQEPGFLRRNMVLSIGHGARHIDNFWVAPPERFTENYVSWNYKPSFRVLSEAIHDTAAVEAVQTTGKVRRAKVAVVTGKATDFNESRLMIDKTADVFAKDCKNAPPKLNQIICRKDQQMLYQALVRAGHAVETITEDDIVDRNALADYAVVYFAGEWVDNRILPKVEKWVEAGGVFYATAGCGHLNQFDRPEPAMLKLLGLKSIRTEKSAAIIRTLLELPLMPAIDALTFDGKKLDAIAMKQQLEVDGAEVLGKWSNGTPAVTVRNLGKGKVFAVGTLAGNTWMKTGTRTVPWARGGKNMLYNPEKFDATAEKLALLGLNASTPAKAVSASVSGVESVVIDAPKGTLVTVANWTNQPIKNLKLDIQLPFAPKAVRLVGGQKDLPVTVKDGRLAVTVDLEDADFILITK